MNESRFHILGSLMAVRNRIGEEAASSYHSSSHLHSLSAVSFDELIQISPDLMLR